MRISLYIVFGSALLAGCGSRHEVSVTARPADPTAHQPAVAAKSEPPIVQGEIIARIIGPYRPTPYTAIADGTNKPMTFWVTLEVTDVCDGFAPELKGKTIRLPTFEFDRALVGQTLPLHVSHSPGRYPESDYGLMCTSIGLARLAASPNVTKR